MQEVVATDGMGTRFFWIRDRKRAPVACVASRPIGLSGVIFNISVVNPKDGFDRETGRSVAVGRLNAKNGIFVEPPNVKKKIMETVAVQDGILGEVKGKPKPTPQRVKKAARLWLSTYRPKEAA